VDFPEPEAHDGYVLISLNADVDPTQRMHLLLRAHVVGLPQVFGANNARFRRSAGLRFSQRHQFCSHCDFLLGLQLIGITHRREFGTFLPSEAG